MAIAIDADCALAYWMSSLASRDTRERVSHVSLIERIETGALPDWAYAPDGTVHVVATSEGERVRRQHVACSRTGSMHDRISFVMSNEGIPVVSPESCVLRLANTLAFPELVKVGLLLCSRFSFDPDACMTGRFEPVTTAISIVKRVNALSNVAGVKKARRAARFLVDNAASPPEADACLLLCLPAMVGGYGCPKPELNGHVKLRVEAARALGYEDCYCDLLWRKEKCAVEYTSEQFHTGYEKQARDEIRRAALEAMGYRVFMLTKPQLYSQSAFDAFARNVLRALGRGMPRKTIDFQSRQYELRKKVLYEPSWVIKRACRM